MCYSNNKNRDQKIPLSHHTHIASSSALYLATPHETHVFVVINGHLKAVNTHTHTHVVAVVWIVERARINITTEDMIRHVMYSRLQPTNVMRSNRPCCINTGQRNGSTQASSTGGLGKHLKVSDHTIHTGVVLF